MSRRTLLYRCSEHRVYARHRWQHRRCRGFDFAAAGRAMIEAFCTPGLFTNVRPIESGQYRYLQETMLPGIEWRRVNDGYRESTGVLKPWTDIIDMDA